MYPNVHSTVPCDAPADALLRVSDDCPAKQATIALAPMEGLVDYHVRQVLCELGAIDYCVSEFLRVSDKVMPAHIFYKICPELKPNHEQNSHKQSGRLKKYEAAKKEEQGRSKLQAHTTSAVPVQLQLLGSVPELMAANAVRAVELGAQAIDLNFGCPAKTVNKRKGGAVMLREPQSLYAVSAAVRAALPAHIPVSAKMRLGYDDALLAKDNALALQEAHVSWLTIHARTRADGYTPPAYWSEIAKIKEVTSLHIIANGEIWNVRDAQRCRLESQCDSLMLGRGLLANPFLACEIASNNNAALAACEGLGGLKIKPSINVLIDYIQRISFSCTEPRALGRLKQWLALMYVREEKLAGLFAEIKVEKSLSQALEKLKTSIL